MAIPTMAQVLTATLEGDSIPAQNTTGTTIYNAIGFLNSVNAISGNRFPYAISQNLAVGGGTLASVNTDKVSQFASATGDILFLCVGTNDWAASVAIGTMQSNLTAIKDYWLTTIQKRIVIIGLLPRTQNGGTPMGSTLIATARTYNSWLVAQRDVANGVHVVDAYDALCTAGTDEPNPSYFKNESGKYLHPNTEGSLVLGQEIWTQLKIDGFSGTDAPPVGSPNLFAYGSMSGSGGTATSPATGTVATGLTVTGSGGSQSRTCTVSNGQRVQFSPSSGDGAAVNFKITASANVTSARGYSVGDTVRGWALISTGTLNLCDGPWLQLSDVGTTTTTYYGYNHGGNTTGYFPSDQKFILMTTPSFAVASGNTGLKPEIVCQLNATGAGAVADVTVHSMGIINETTARAVSTTDLRGILLPNVDPTPPVAIFDGDYPEGDWTPVYFTALRKEDFTAGTLGSVFETWDGKSVFANDQPSVLGRSLKITVAPNTQANLNVAACAGGHNFGGRSVLPIPIPIGKSIWVSWKRYIPSDFTWGYCYANADSAEATACSQNGDGNAWLKDLVLAPTNGFARIYIQPSVSRRSVAQTAGNRVICENGPIYTDESAVTYPLGQWFTHQVQIYVHDTSAGYIREWINYDLVNEVTGANVTAANSINEYGIGDYWNGVPYTDGTASLSYWVRELIIATDVSGYGAPTGLDSGGRVFIHPSTTVASLS